MNWRQPSTQTDFAAAALGASSSVRHSSWWSSFSVEKSRVRVVPSVAAGGLRYCNLEAKGVCGRAWLAGCRARPVAYEQ
jgi:hypothetical protein